RGRSFGRQCGKMVAGRGDHGHATADEVGHERRQAIVLTRQPVIFDHHVLALDGAGFVEALTERSAKARGVIGRPTADEADDRHRGLLRARREWPRDRRAPKQRDELAPLHSMTSSARPSSVGGTVRPSTLAVLRLMTNAIFVICWTGRSAG